MAKKKQVAVTRNMLNWRIKGLVANIDSLLYVFKDVLTSSDVRHLEDAQGVINQINNTKP